MFYAFMLPNFLRLFVLLVCGDDPTTLSPVVMGARNVKKYIGLPRELLCVEQYDNSNAKTSRHKQTTRRCES